MVMPRPAIGFWIAQVAYWAAAYVVNILLCSGFDVADPTAFILAECGLCFAATAAIRCGSKRQSFLRWTTPSQIGMLAGSVLIASVIVQGVLLATGRYFGIVMPPQPEIVARLLVTLTMIVNWCAFYFGYQLVRDHNSTAIRALEAEAEALRHELKHLQAQISPHFLMNALNTIQACRDDPDAITTLTQSLAAYLRFLIQPAAPLEPLSREFDALEDYFTIQGVRFGDGLETRIDCDFDVRGMMVPAVMVQPLVENAITYGGQTAPLPIRVHVAARREGDRLVVEVANAGRWVAPARTRSTGTGLASLKRRLQLLVGPGCSLTHCEEDGWVRVTIRIPVPAWQPADPQVVVRGDVR